jgi:hypothetical protein
MEISKGPFTHSDLGRRCTKVDHWETQQKCRREGMPADRYSMKGIVAAGEANGVFMEEIDSALLDIGV